MSKARLSSEYITQLKSLQELRDCGVFSDEEFLEQKSFALNNIRSINTKKMKISQSQTILNLCIMNYCVHDVT